MSSLAGPGPAAEVVTAGETMICVSPHAATTFAETALCSRGIGGAETNTAIGLARLGVSAAWFSRLGADEFAAEILATLDAERVAFSTVVRDRSRPTGVMFKERPTPHDSRVRYYRCTSAASRLGPDDVHLMPIAGAQVLHLTGITSGLGAGPREFVREAMRSARAAGLTVVFDPNFRPALWNADEARAEYRRLAPSVDHLLLNAREATLLTGHDDPLRAAQSLRDLGPSVAIVKCGIEGAVAAVGGSAVVVPVHPIRAVDSVGAGDAFNAGWIFAHLNGLPLELALQTAAWVAAHVTAHAGDYEGAPTSAQWRTAFASETVCTPA